MRIFLAINREASVGGVVVWTTTGYCRRMQEIIDIDRKRVAL